MTVAEVTRADGAVAPAIFVGEEGQVEVLREPLAMAFSEVDLQRPYRRVFQRVQSVAQLVRYYIELKRPTLDEQGLRSLIENYILKRAKGDPDLGWLPMSRSALESEVKNISVYSDFCQRRYGHLPLLGTSAIPLPASTEKQKSFWKLMACNEHDFFSHLAARRAPSNERIQIPGRKYKRGGTESSVGMSEEFAWDLIRAERNPAFKALWLLGFFGGPRLSESLNLWVCDVLPGSFRAHWFSGDIFVDLPLVVIANPWESRWCGKIGDERRTRLEFLSEEYGLQPRPLMAETDGGQFRGKAAGFKGTTTTNRSTAMRQLFWVSEEAAMLFAETIVEVVQTRNRIPGAKLHPFLFVNTDARKPDLQGHMLALSNVRKAFERAVRRLGATPYRWRQRPHGMRHFYKDKVYRLVGGDAGAVQICMGHRSRDSQNDYGSLDMQALQHAMSRRTRESS